MSANYRDEGSREGDSPAGTKPGPAGLAVPDLDSVQEENARLKDDFLRLAAEFDNYRKRTRRDLEQGAAAEKEAFICELLPVMDNLERAAACGRSVSLEQLQQGVQMTLLQLRALLRRHEIEATGEVAQPFDPHQQEALALRNNPNEPDQTILEVVERGYRRGPKLLRPAKVIVNDHDYLPGGPRGR